MMISQFAEQLGRESLKALKNLIAVLDLISYSARNMKVLRIVPVRTVLNKQLFFTGIEAMNKIALIGAVIGIVIITQISNLAGQNAELTGKILVWTVVRELGPLLAAIIIIARSGTAISSELGSMGVNREMDNLTMMGINFMDYLIVPRIAGITVSVFILTIYFQIIAIGGGMALSSLLIQLPFLQHMEGIFSSLRIYDILVSLFKSLVFGIIISAVACTHGLMVRDSITEIPQAATRAVMQSLFLVIISDGIITVLAYI
jgi:phospholipid/cholesterol/gamma-HCH transport system permease protein